MKPSHAFSIIAALACSLAVTPVRGGGSEPRTRVSHSTASSHLTINRAPNFGTQSNISLFIDGQRVGTLGYGRSFKGFLPAGRHFITMQQTPHLNDAYPYSQQWIKLTPGRRSTFTAIWREGGTRISLEES
jgi:hypothetical protein